VTTAQVTDATPAAFGAHVRDRAEQSEIARQ
jgi:alkaline phosphatase